MQRSGIVFEFYDLMGLHRHTDALKLLEVASVDEATMMMPKASMLEKRHKTVCSPCR